MYVNLLTHCSGERNVEVLYVEMVSKHGSEYGIGRPNPNNSQLGSYTSHSIKH